LHNLFVLTGTLHVLVIAPVVTTTSITLSSNKIRNGDILVLDNAFPPGKWPLKRRDREFYTIAATVPSIFLGNIRGFRPTDDDRGKVVLTKAIMVTINFISYWTFMAYPPTASGSLD